MKEELTTAMHAEFLGDEVTEIELRVWDIYGSVNRGIPLSEALKKNGIPEDDYLKYKYKYLSAD